MGTDPAGHLNRARAVAFDALTIGGYLVYLSFLSVATHVTNQAWLGLCLAPLPMLLLRMDGFRIMLIVMAGFLLFFEGYRPASNFLFLNTPDSLMLAFAAVYLFNRRGYATLTFPVSPALIPLYAFIAYGLALSVLPLTVYGADNYVLRDIKNILYLILIPILCRSGESLFAPKRLFLILYGFMIFAAMHAMVVLIDFLATGNRILTWNEVFFADGVLLAPILLGLDLRPRTRWILQACLAICLLGLLGTQTRGLWLSALLSFILYAFLRVRRSGRFNAGAALKAAPIALIFFLIAEIILRLSSGKGLADFLLDRMSSHQANELVNPWSSLGYRIHESMVVWEKRTWFGHGSGARLYLFFTQLGMSKFINWWSIHSEYFEILHKYGFIGLGLFLWFLGAILIRARRLAMRGKRFPSTVGFAALITLTSHCLVSITSGYLVRENVMFYMVLMVAMVEYYLPRVDAETDAAEAPREPRGRAS